MENDEIKLRYQELSNRVTSLECQLSVLKEQLDFQERLREYEDAMVRWINETFTAHPSDCQPITVIIDGKEFILHVNKSENKIYYKFRHWGGMFNFEVINTNHLDHVRCTQGAVELLSFALDHDKEIKAAILEQLNSFRNASKV